MNRLPTELIQLIFKAGPLHCLKNLSACNRRLRRVFCHLVRKITVYAYFHKLLCLQNIYPNLTHIHGAQIRPPGLRTSIKMTCLNILDSGQYISLSLDQLKFWDFKYLASNCDYLKLKLRVPDCQSSDLSLLQPVCLVQLLESLVDLPCRIKIIASTRYNAVTFTNRAYRAHLQGGPALLPEEFVSMQ